MLVALGRNPRFQGFRGKEGAIDGVYGVDTRSALSLSCASLRAPDELAEPIRGSPVLSAPKKGKDLSALKARLAKKAAEAEGESPSTAAPTAADVPAPGGVAAAVPAPGEVQKPASPVADIPAPGEVKKPVDIPAPGEVSKPVDIPAPGEVSRPAPAPEPAPAYAQRGGDLSDDPMSGGVAFDPNDGLFDDAGGEIKAKSSVGLPLFAGLIGILVGAGLGWMAHRMTDGKSRVDSAKAKAVSIKAKVEQIESNRATIALKVGAASDALQAKEADKAVEALSGLEPTFVELGDLFGWQMATMDPVVIKQIFDLAESNNSLQLDVGILKGWVAANKEVLASRAAGPSSFVVIQTPKGGAILAEYVSGICGDVPEELPEDFKPESLEKCDGEAILNAKAFLVRTEIGGKPTLVPGTQASLLIPDGPIYTYAIGATPEANAKAYFDIRMGRINEVLANMVKLNESAMAGIGNYTDNPAVNGE
jgi:hypothetical protein